MDNSTYQALAMLYVKNQDLSNLSPEELLDQYKDAYEKIKLHGDTYCQNGNDNNWLY